VGGDAGDADTLGKVEGITVCFPGGLQVILDALVTVPVWTSLPKGKGLPRHVDVPASYSKLAPSQKKICISRFEGRKTKTQEQYRIQSHPTIR